MTPGLKSTIVGVGCLVCEIRSTGFKLALVVSMPNAEGKYLVRVWRAASKRWTYPRRVPNGQLRHITDDDLDFVDHGARVRHNLITKAASEAVTLGYVRRTWS
jgi:hypothetical protein